MQVTGDAIERQMVLGGKGVEGRKSPAILTWLGFEGSVYYMEISRSHLGSSGARRSGTPRG
jgi:hypothetical protein